MNVPLSFLLKKAVSGAIMPLSIVLLFFALGGLYILLRRSREGVAPFTMGALLLYACSLNSVAAYFIGPLERAYPAYNLQNFELAGKDVRWVVVLGSNQRSNPSLPPIAILDESALFRLAEGIRLANHYSQSVLVLSGGKIDDTQSSAQAMATAAANLGFDPGRILLEDQSLDTHDEAVRVKEMVGDDTFVLVTSAAHMLRSMKLFEAEGMHPLAAPALYRAKGGREWLIPRPGNIVTCHEALHEYLGLGWGWMRGSITFDTK